jgi:hypothetical protein
MDATEVESRAWTETLAVLRRRVDRLRQGGETRSTLVGDAGPAALARLRRVSRPLLEALATAYGDLCPPGYPALEDNEIAGAGGSVGLRLTRWHAVYFALEHARGEKKKPPPPAGLAGALGVVPKRLPGEPLPPPDPNVALELVVLSLRWDDNRGWVEVRRPLAADWSVETLREHLVAYVIGFNYDVAAGHLGADAPAQGSGR